MSKSSTGRGYKDCYQQGRWRLSGCQPGLLGNGAGVDDLLQQGLGGLKIGVRLETLKQGLFRRPGIVVQKPLTAGDDPLQEGTGLRKQGPFETCL